MLFPVLLLLVMGRAGIAGSYAVGTGVDRIFAYRWTAVVSGKCRDGVVADLVSADRSSAADVVRWMPLLPLLLMVLRSPYGCRPFQTSALRSWRCF